MDPYLSRPLVRLACAVLAVAVSGCGPEALPGSGTATSTESDTPVLFDDLPAHSGVEGEPRAGASEEFWGHWGDGRAELSSYRLRTSHYGELREGELVLIYVTEPHDRRTWIKDDEAPDPHRAEVLKLNVSRKFMTGIYPYSVMTSVFSPVADWGGHRFRPTKITMSAQEWCGNYHRQIWPGREGFRALTLSYFAGEGERLGEEEAPEGTLYEDALWIQLRELDGPFAGGEDWEGLLVPSLWDHRRGHGNLEAVPATITREERAEPTLGGEAVDDPGRVTVFTLRYGEVEKRIEVERTPPRRILGWSTSRGETVELAESRRLPYWRLNGSDGARFRSELGLDPGASGRPPS